MKAQCKWIFCYLLLATSLVAVGEAVNYEYLTSSFSRQYKANIQTLQQVHAVFRHGDRTPIQNTFPTDAYGNESVWKGGWGQLTELGEESQFLLGRFLGLRYAGFLKDKSECYVQSSDIDRAIVSAQANLAGLFPIDNGKKHWGVKHKLNWQPVPVHTLDASLDNKINFAADCFKYKLLLQNLLESPFVAQVNKKNEELYEYLTKHTGRIVLDFPVVAEIYDSLFVQKSHGLKLPDWAEGVYEEKMKRLAILPFDILTFDEEMTRLRAGPLLQEILDHMEAVINKTDQKKNPRSAKFYVYSGHDTTISAILTALNVYDKSHIPPYSSIVLIELHKSSEENFFVKIFYHNSTDQPLALKIPKCEIGESGTCYYDTFKKLVSSYSISKEAWKRECSKSEAKNKVVWEYIHPYQTYQDMSKDFRRLAVSVAQKLYRIFSFT